MIIPPYSDVDEGADACEVPRRVRCAWLVFSKPSCPATSSEPEAGAESVMCEMVSAFSQPGVKGFLVGQLKDNQCYWNSSF